MYMDIWTVNARNVLIRLLFGVSLCAVNGSSGVMGRRVDGRELEGALFGVDDVVPCAARNKDCVSGVQAAFGIQTVFTVTQ